MREIQAGRPVTLLSVLAASAEVADASVQKRQRSYLNALLDHDTTRAAVVTSGEGIRGVLVRASARTLTPHRSNLFMTGTVLDAARWLANERGSAVSEIVSAFEQARAFNP